MNRTPPVASYPGYQQAQSQGAFNTPQTVDLAGLLGLAKQILGHVGQAYSSPTTTQAQSSPTPSLLPSATPTPAMTRSSLDEQVRKGFLNYAKDTPLATQSGVIAQALKGLSPNIDPRLILALSLKETRGGKDLIGRKQGLNNPYNVMPDGKLANYPDLQTALMGGANPLEGGVQSQGLIKLLNSPLYKKYQQSGDLKDFFNTYSPAGAGNASLDTQVQQAKELMKYFQ